MSIDDRLLVGYGYCFADYLFSVRKLFSQKYTITNVYTSGRYYAMKEVKNDVRYEKRSYAGK